LAFHLIDHIGIDKQFIAYR